MHYEAHLFRFVPVHELSRSGLSRQTSHDSVVLMENTGVIRGLPIDVDHLNLILSEVLTKDSEVIRDLPTDGDQWKTETTKRSKQIFPQTDYSWIEY